MAVALTPCSTGHDWAVSGDREDGVRALLGRQVGLWTSLMSAWGPWRGGVRHDQRPRGPRQAGVHESGALA